MKHEGSTSNTKSNKEKNMLNGQNQSTNPLHKIS